MTGAHVEGAAGVGQAFPARHSPDAHPQHAHEAPPNVSGASKMTRRELKTEVR